MSKHIPAPKITLGHLYPGLLNLYGDRGNVLALFDRARRHALTVHYVPIKPGARLVFKAYDILFMGGGQSYEQEQVVEALQEQLDELRTAVEQGLVILAISGSYQLLGRHYPAGNTGKLAPGLGLLDLESNAGRKRMTGNIVTRCDLWQPPRTLDGFENHAGCTFLGPSVRPLGKVLRGYGNNGRDRTEGVVYRNVFGTYLHGALLPKNPWLADYLLQKALERHYPGYILKPREYALEEQAHRAALRRTGLRSIFYL